MADGWDVPCHVCKTRIYQGDRVLRLELTRGQGGPLQEDGDSPRLLAAHYECANDILCNCQDGRVAMTAKGLETCSWNKEADSGDKTATRKEVLSEGLIPGWQEQVLVHNLPTGVGSREEGTTPEEHALSCLRVAVPLGLWRPTDGQNPTLSVHSEARTPADTGHFVSQACVLCGV